MASAESPLLLPPWGILGVSSPLTRKTTWLSSGFCGSITFSSGVPCISLANEVRSSLPLVNPGRSLLWQPTQLATRIGATSLRKLVPVAVDLGLSVSAFLAAGAAVEFLTLALRPFLVAAGPGRVFRSGWGTSLLVPGTCMLGSC